MKYLNILFFDDEKPHISDLLWVYGMYTIVSLITLYAAMKVF